MTSGGRSGHGCALLGPGEVVVVGGDSYPTDVSTKADIFIPFSQMRKQLKNILNVVNHLDPEIDETLE